MKETYDLLKRGLSLEFSTDPGKANMWFGVAFVLLIVLSYVPTVADRVIDVVNALRSGGQIEHAPAVPGWAIVLVAAYGFGCMVYLGQKQKRAEGSRG